MLFRASRLCCLPDWLALIKHYWEAFNVIKIVSNKPLQINVSLLPLARHAR